MIYLCARCWALIRLSSEVPTLFISHGLCKYCYLTMTPEKMEESYDHLWMDIGGEG